MPEFLTDALFDTLKALPFLFGAFLLMEYIEHRGADRLTHALARPGAFGPIAGAAAGCIPQCGLAAAAANLFAAGVISPGTLLAVFITASDEAVPMLFAAPEAFPVLLKLILIKLAAGMLFGILVDLLIFRALKEKPAGKSIHEFCEDAGKHHSILEAALKHTVKIAAFLLAVNVLLGFVIGLIGEENLARLLLTGGFQPFLTALVGFIPNCAASVLLTRLYLQGLLSFGALTAGLCTSAGVGLAVLFQAGRQRAKENLKLMGCLYLSAVLTGLAAGFLTV